MDLIETWAKITLVVLFFTGLCGLLLHAWFNSRLSFFKFGESDSSDKKSFKRLILPWIIVAVICALIPVLVYYSHPELIESLKANEDFVKFPWKYIMPAVAMEVSIFTCAIIGSLFYFVLGYISWQIWKISYTSRFGR